MCVDRSHKLRLTASIVTYHTDPAELSNAINALLLNGVERLWIVDNSSSDEIRNLVGSWKEAVYVASENRGYGAGHNQALRRALDLGADYHLVMNSDIDFGAGTLSPMLGYLDRNPDVGMVQPRIVGLDGELQYTVRRLPAPIDLIGRRFFPRWMLGKRADRYELRHIDHTRPFNVPYHQGSFMLIRCAVLHQTGLFDERFFMYPEDIDLTRRVHARFRTMYLPSPTVVHAHRRESYASGRMLAIHCLNMIRYFNKWGWVFDRQRREFNGRIGNMG